MKKLLTILLVLIPVLAFSQQTRKISGRIIDSSDGSPLAGATVFIDPSNKEAADYTPQGAVAGLDGSFVFEVPTSVKYVVASFIGYESQDVEIAGGNNFTIGLQPSSSQLETVVVTGYQTIEKRKLTSSVSTINMDEINRAGAASIDQMLEGQLAGVFSSPTSGGPGTANRIQIRSAVTFSGNADPLWVLDGIPLEGNDIPKDWNSNDNIDNLYSMSIAGINPNDIQSINVLKDAAATSIYGARAANGVIVITTKSGRRNQKLQVDVNATTFITERPKFGKLNLMNASEKVDFELQVAQYGRLSSESQRELGGVARILDSAGERGALISDGWNGLSSDTQAAINALRTDGTNWGKEIYRMTLNQQYGVSISGGGQRTAYYFSGGFYDEQGTTKKTGYNRFNLTAKNDWYLLDNLKFGSSVFLTQSKTKSYVTDKYSFMNPSNYSRNVNPYLRMKDEDGNYIYDPDATAESSSSLVLDYNYDEERRNTDYFLKNQSIKTIFDLEYKPVSGLTLSTQFGWQTEKNDTEKSANKNTYYTRWYEQQSKIQQVIYLPEGGVIQNWNQSLSQYTWKTQAEYSRSLKGGHEFNAMAGVELRENTSEQVHTKGFGYDAKTLVTRPIIFPDNDAGLARANSADFRQYQKTYYKNRYVSYYATASYSYADRYIFFGSLRYDGTNLFGIDRKYQYTPLWSLSGAWNIHRESFMSDTPWLNVLKLRASYGLQGNVDRETSPYIIGQWTTTTVGGGTEDRILVNSPPNPNLRWETTDTWNIGLDLSVLKNRVNLTAEYYNRVSKDLISVRELPHETGFYQTSTNYGKIAGKGWEISLRTINVVTPSFRWETSFNIAHNKTKVKRMLIPDNSWTPSLEGHSLGAVYGFKTAGLDDRGIPLFWSGGEKVTLEEFVNFRVEAKEMFGYPYLDGAVDNSNSDFRSRMSYLGSTDPKLTGGFNNTFRYKFLDLSVSANFVIKQFVMRTPFYYPTKISPGRNYSREMADVWTPGNTSGKYPVYAGSALADGTDWQQNWYDYDDYAVYNYIMDNFGISNLFWQRLDIWGKKMSYIRVNNIRLGYTFPESIAGKIGMSSLRVSFEARNPFVISTNYKGYFDPETYGNVYAQPLPRTYSFSINVTF